MTETDSPAGIRRATVADVDAMAALHAECIAEGFLVTLGPAFLRRLYGRIVRSSRAFAMVASERDGVVGYVACAVDTGAFYREFAWRDGLVAGTVAAARIIRAPRHVWETWRYGTRTPPSANDDADAGASGTEDAEVLALAVAPEARGRRLGGALVTAAVEELRGRDVTSARVVTAEGNVSAVRAYEAAGFRRFGTDEVHRGVRQEVLRWP